MYIVWQNLGFDGYNTTECNTWVEIFDCLLNLVGDKKRNRDSFDQWLLGKTDVMHINGHDTFITSSALPSNHNDGSATVNMPQIR